MEVRSWIAASTFSLLFVIQPANALDPTRRISQYAHTAWRTQDGAFSGTPNVVAQTTDGYIWIGTNAGLVKFDGVRFRLWEPPKGQRLANSTIYSLLGAKDGSLWIGSSARLEQWKNNRLFEFSNVTGRFNVILEDHAGKIWVARSRTGNFPGGICGVADTLLQCFGNSGGMFLPYADALDEDEMGNLWIGGPELLRWKSGSWNSWFREKLKPTLGLDGIQALAAGGDGTVWVGFQKTGLGLQRLVQGVPRRPALDGIDASNLSPSSLFVDRAKNLWVGTEDRGIYRIHGQQVDHFRSEDGLSGNYISSFYEDREGNLWVATSKGVDIFRDISVATLSVREGLSAENAQAVLAARDGTIWIGSSGVGLDRMHGNQVSTLRGGQGLPGQQVTSLFQDREGRLWIGIDQSLAIYEGGQFRKVIRPDGSSLGAVTALAEDTDRNIWAFVTGRDRRLFRIQDMRVREEFTPSQIPYGRALAADPSGGLWLGLQTGDLAHHRDGKFQIFALHSNPSGNPILDLSVDEDGSAWAATQNGLVRWKQGTLRTLTSKNGLPCNKIFALVRDDDKALWLSSECGLVAIPDPELVRWWRQPDTAVSVRVLDVFDGALPGLTNFQPNVSKSPDGRLWFANNNVVQVVDPHHLAGNRMRPPVQIEQIVADRKNYAPQDNLHLPPRTRDLEIDYTALSFVAPQKVRFRYQLEGRDVDWQDAGVRRQAFYNDLPPGSYTFHVMACNNDGLWNEAGAVLNFSVAAAYYQTLWFRLLSAGLGMAALAFAYRSRVAQIERGRAAQQAFALRLITSQENERKRIAAELHDSLGQRLVIIKNLALLSLQPASAKDSVRERIEEISSEASSAIGEVKEISYNLRPYQLDRMGLTQAVESLVRSVAAASHIDITAALDNIDDVFSKEIQINFYRIVQEALNNIVKHSEANKASVVVERTEGRLSLVIRDNGNGNPPKAGNPDESDSGFGLTGMVERGQSLGGKTSISFAAGQGTTIDFEVVLRRET